MVGNHFSIQMHQNFKKTNHIHMKELLAMNSSSTHVTPIKFFIYLKKKLN